MTRAEAKRRVCDGTATLINEGGANLWLEVGDDGRALSVQDEKRMLDARDELVAELRRRGQK